MIKLYFHPSANPIKVALYLEETKTPYEIVVTDTRKGDQHKPEYRAINPNGKTPSIVDGDIQVFDSTAIMLYLGEKIGQFMPCNDPKEYAKFYQWLMFMATGVAPYSGQLVHFKYYAPEKLPYAINRYDFEAWRHWQILEDHLANQPYMLNEYGILDMTLWAWARRIPFILGEDAWEKLPRVKRLHDEISAKPQAKNVEAIKTKFNFQIEIDDAARKNLFPSNERL